MGTTIEEIGSLEGKDAESAHELEAAQERYDEAAQALRKAKKPLLKACADLATFNNALAAALLAGNLSPEQKEDAVKTRVALAMPFGTRASKFANAYRALADAERLLAEAEKLAGETDEDGV